VYPILGVIAAENLHPIDHPETMEEKLRNIEEKYQKRFNENWAIRQRLEKEGKRKEQEKYIAQYHAISIEQAEVVDKAERDFLRQFTSQANFARSLLRLSPAECFSNAAEAVVSTDIEAYDRFMEINRQFWHQYVEHYKKALYENRPEAREMKFPEEPKIKYPLSESLQRATIDIALLILLAGLCFIAAYTIFVRSEV
jgi:hypothetical protein